MNWDQIQGQWRLAKSVLKERWGRLTDDELDIIAGRREQLEGKIQTAYGRSKDQVRRDVDDFLAACDLNDADPSSS